MLTNRLYDILSKIQRWLPALGVFYLALCKIWGLSYGSEINDTIVALATLMACTLEISSAKYYRAESTVYYTPMTEKPEEEAHEEADTK